MWARADMPITSCGRLTPAVGWVRRRALSFSAERGLLNARRDDYRDSPGDWLEMGDAAERVLVAAALEPAAGGFVFCKEQDLQIPLVNEVQQKVEEVVDAEVVEINEGVVEQERDRFGHRAHVLGEANAQEQVGGSLGALAEDVDVNETAGFGDFSGDAEGGRIEHGLLVATVGDPR